MISPEDLRHYTHFGGLPEECLKEISMISGLRPFAAGERIFEEGDKARALYLVRDGEVDILYRLGDNREVVADTVIKGEALSWSALLEPYQLTASGVGRKAGTLIEIDAEKLRAICASDAESGFQILKEIAKTLRSRLAGLRVQIAAQQ